ncbi:MAG: tetratricopeptide repeat protein [Raineya sp.]|jgi:signal transduction histidine kinase|nr:tetratricopeptide repeat protein [Raineya sp.]
MKRAILLIFSLTFCYFSQAQNRKAVDSLMKIYQTAKHDSTRILTLVEIAFLYHRNKPDTCIAISKQVIEKSEKIDYQKGKSRGLNSMAAAYRVKSSYQQALENQFKSLKIAEEINDKQGVSNNFAGLGMIYRLQGNYPLALEYQFKSLKIAEEANRKIEMANGYNNIGNIYNIQGNNDLALEYYKKSLKIREEINDKIGIATSLGSISIIYRNTGKYELALETYQKSLKIFEELKDKQGIAIVLEHLGNIYDKQGNYPLALEYLFKSLKACEEIGDKEGMTYCLGNIAGIYQKTKEYDKSIEYASKGLEIAKEVKALPQIKYLSKALYEAYKLKGNFSEALELHELYKKVNDSMFNVDRAKAIANLESKVELEKKQKEIEILNKDRKLQQIDAEKERNARLALQKESEAKELWALAQKEQDRRKQDSLLALAQKASLEASRLKAVEKQLQAESEKKQLEILKEKEARKLQSYIVYLVLVGFISVLIFTYFIYRSKQKEKKAKEEVLHKNEEISMQAEEIRSQRDTLDIQRTELIEKNQEISITLENLAQVNATKDKLFAIIGHDLRSPINTLLSMINLLKNEYISQEEFTKLSGNLKSNVENIHFTLNNLLSWANSQREGLVTNPQSVYIHTLVEENIRFLEEVAKAKDIHLENSMAENVVVWADNEQINLVIRNLMSNALKFTPKHGLVKMQAILQNDFYEIAIEDNGMGMSQEQMNKLFQETTHFSTIGTQGEKGTGIGLLLCKEMIEENNGKISVESQVGKGTIFRVSLPAGNKHV